MGEVSPLCARAKGEVVATLRFMVGSEITIEGAEEGISIFASWVICREQGCAVEEMVRPGEWEKWREGAGRGREAGRT